MAKDSDLIKDNVDITDVIKSYINLQPAGRNFKALCPFHQEKTPSFIVSPTKKIWHCFGCGLGGDVIKFVMLYENLDFPEALRLLADKAGIKISSYASRDQKAFEVLYQINQAAKEFYAQNLTQQPAVMEYLTKRGLSRQTIEEFGLGYAPPGDKLTLHLINAGFRVDDIIKAGLSFKSAAGLFRDRFAGRIVFPIINETDRTVAFTGRIFNDSANDQAPKYLNSPETPIFNKSKLLYGLVKAKPHILKERSVLLVEGQMDFLALWQAGIKAVLAVSGTSLTREHLVKIKRLADNLIFSFDNDSAGVKAIERSLETLTGFDFLLKTVDWGSYKDPAEACLADPKFAKAALKKARPVYLALFEHYFKDQELDSRNSQFKKTVRSMLKIISRLASSIEQDTWLKALAEFTGISELALRTELSALEEYQADTNFRPDASAGESSEVPDRIDLIARRLALLTLNSAHALDAVRANLDFLPAKYRSVVEKGGSNEGQFSNSDILDLESTYVLSNFTSEADLQAELSDLIKQLKLESLKKKRAEIKRKLRLAVSNRQEKEAKEFLAAFSEISRQIESLSCS